MTTKAAFKQSPDAMVMPPDQDPDDPALVPFDEYDYADKLSDLAAKVDDSPNRFVCPVEGCETDHTGYPDECDECGTEYNW